MYLAKAEIARNAANPGLSPKVNSSITFNVEAGTADLSVALPVSAAASAAGALVYAPTDYLGGAYSAFTAGGDVTATTIQGAIAEIAQTLSGLENAIDAADRPNYIQVDSSSETLVATITAKLPGVFTISTTGTIDFVATDYL